MLESKIELLQRVPLFSGLDAEKLSAIAAIGRKTYFEAGQNLIEEDEVGDKAFLIMTGKASCKRLEGREAIDEDLWPGTLVGELAMIVETTHSITVTATERLRALAFEREAFHAVMHAHSAIADHISARLLDRLRELAESLRVVDNCLAEVEKAA